MAKKTPSAAQNFYKGIVLAQIGSPQSIPFQAQMQKEVLAAQKATAKQKVNPDPFGM